MNQMFDRECSSGCESGWTLYLDNDNDNDNSLLSPYPSQKSDNHYFKHDEYEEEDLSMVSDASSGPPHFCDDEYYGNESSNNGLFVHTPTDATLPKNNGKRKKNNEHRRHQEQQLAFLDDTASSSVSNFSTNDLALSSNHAYTENMLDYSQAHSSTQFEGKSRLQEHYGFFKYPVSGTKLQQNQWSERKKVGMR